MRKLLAALLVVGAVIGAGWYLTQRSVSIDLVRAPIAPATWQTYQDAVAASPPIDAKLLIDAVTHANRAEVAAGVDPSNLPSFRAAASAVSTQAWQFVQRTSPETFMQLGRQRGLALIAALEALLAWSAETGTSTDAALDMSPPPPVVQTYIDLGGGFVRFAQDAGFIVHGKLRNTPFVQGLFLRHWIAPLTQSMPLDAFVTREERTWHLRWKVEAQSKGGLESRIAAADELRKVTGYPADLNAGVLLYQAGRVDEARARWSKATGPKAEAYLRTVSK